MGLIALVGVTTGFLAAGAAHLRYDTLACAPEHPEPGKVYPHATPCVTGAAFAAEMVRIEAAAEARRKARAQQEGPFLAWLRGDD
jgi:hypothetical protein